MHQPINSTCIILPSLFTLYFLCTFFFLIPSCQIFIHSDAISMHECGHTCLPTHVSAWKCIYFFKITIKITLYSEIGLNSHCFTKINTQFPFNILTECKSSVQEQYKVPKDLLFRFNSSAVHRATYPSVLRTLPVLFFFQLLMSYIHVSLNIMSYKMWERAKNS